MPQNPLIQPAPLVQTIDSMRDSNLSLADMLNTYEGRFASIEPEIQSFIEEANRFERLRQHAQQLYATYPESASRPPLYGALVGIKDIFHVDGFVTHAGTHVPPEFFAGEQASVVTKLIEAGALIGGKTVTTEFAYYEPGPTRNPHNLAHTPGGSSSGSAAAVASGLVHVALGTQTVGSVIRPAAFCGIVGYKPSFDRIDTAGLVYFSRSADHVGLFTQDIAGMQLVASVLVNHWDNSITPERKPILAVPDGEYLGQATALAEFEAHVKHLQDAGYTVKRIQMLDDIQSITDIHTDMIAAELAGEHQAWFEQYNELYRPRTAALVRKGQSVSPNRLEQGRDHRLTLRTRLETLAQENDVDIWICPAAPDTAPEGIRTTGDPAMNLPWTHCGVPVVTVPAGTGKNGLPLGLQLCSATFGGDEALLYWAKAIETAFQ